MRVGFPGGEPEESGDIGARRKDIRGIRGRTNSWDVHSWGLQGAHTKTPVWFLSPPLWPPLTAARSGAARRWRLRGGENRRQEQRAQRSGTQGNRRGGGEEARRRGGEEARRRGGEEVRAQVGSRMGLGHPSREREGPSASRARARGVEHPQRGNVLSIRRARPRLEPEAALDHAQIACFVEK